MARDQCPWAQNSQKEIKSETQPPTSVLDLQHPSEQTKVSRVSMSESFRTASAWMPQEAELELHLGSIHS